MQAGRVPSQCDILVAGPAGNVLVSRPAEERGLKPSLATTTAEVSRRVIVTLALQVTHSKANFTRASAELHHRARALGPAFKHVVLYVDALACAAVLR